MTKFQIEEWLVFAFQHNWTPNYFGLWLTGAPHFLAAADATQAMHEYRRRYPKAGTNPKVPVEPSFLPGPTPKLPRRKAKAKPTVAAEGPGELSTAAPRPSIINRSAVKAFALKASKEKRAGKFERVSKEFLDSVEANLEALIREIADGFATRDTVVPDPESDWFINGRTLRCVEDKLNQAVQKIVLAKVHGHPTVGKTLK